MLENQTENIENDMEPGIPYRSIWGVSYMRFSGSNFTRAIWGVSREI